MANRWRGHVLSVARSHAGIDRMILNGAAKHVKTEEGQRVALAALGYEAGDDVIESIQERIKVDEEAAAREAGQ